jgi:hypothetical protein
MAKGLQIKVLDSLPQDFMPPASKLGIAFAEGVKGRLIPAKRRAYWYAMGLRPAMAGSGVVLDEVPFDTTDDKVLRIGDRELWVETEGHYAQRAAYLRKNADVRGRVLEETARLRDEAESQGLEVQAYQGRQGGEFSSGPWDEEAGPAGARTGALDAMQAELSELRAKMEALGSASSAPQSGAGDTDP